MKGAIVVIEKDGSVAVRMTGYDGAECHDHAAVIRELLVRDDLDVEMLERKEITREEALTRQEVGA